MSTWLDIADAEFCDRLDAATSSSVIARLFQLALGQAVSTPGMRLL
jgi:hypothetical protein